MRGASKRTCGFRQIASPNPMSAIIKDAASRQVERFARRTPPRWPWPSEGVFVSPLPGVRLKCSFQRGPGDAAGVVGDRGGGNDGNDLQGMVLAETGGGEAIDFLGVQAPALFDHRSRQR